MEERELSAEAKKARLEYIKEWRHKNRDKVRQYNANYWEKRASKTIIEKKGNEND